MADRIIRATNGVSFGARIKVGDEDLGSAKVDAVAEVLKLTVAEVGTLTSGDVSIVLRGATAVDIAILNTDDEDAIAGKIASGSFTGWSASATDNVVTFTADTAGAKTGANSFDGGDTGVEASFAVSTAGANEIPATTANVTAVFKGVGEDPVNFDIVVSVLIVDSVGINQPLSDIKISYPVDGKGVVKIEDGSTFKLAKNDVISLIAQRA